MGRKDGLYAAILNVSILVTFWQPWVTLRTTCRECMVWSFERRKTPSELGLLLIMILTLCMSERFLCRSWRSILVDNITYKVFQDVKWSIYSRRKPSVTCSNFAKLKTIMTSKSKKRDRSGEKLKKKLADFSEAWLTFIRPIKPRYVLLRRKGQIYEFKSTDEVWPLPPANLVCVHDIKFGSRN